MNEQDTRVGMFEGLYDKAERQRDDDIACPHPFAATDIDRPWYYYDRLYRGYHWDFLTQMDSWASRPVKNLAAIAVESYTTMLTDNKPSVVVSPREESDSELADFVRSGIGYWWDKEHAQEKVALAVKASRIFGIGWLYLYHHPKKGECLRFVHPESVLVDPNTTVEHYDPAYIIYEDITSVGALQEEFPKHDFDDFVPGWKPGYDTASRVQYKRYADNENPNKSTPVYRVWMKDAAVEDYEGDLRGVAVKGKRKKYPKGRYLVIAGGECLHDGENEYAHGEVPLTPIHAYPVPGRFYGVGDVQNLLNIIVMRNRMSQFLFDTTVRSGGGWVLVGERSGIDPNKVSAAPLQILPCADASPQHFRVERPLPPSRHVFDYIAMLDADADDVMGLHDISRGAYTPGNKTAQEIAVLSESDRTRVRMAARWLTWALERVGKQLVSNLAQWNDWSWWVRVGESSVKMDGSMLVKRDEASGKLTKENIEFDLSFADSSTLPPSQQQTYERVSWLLGNQVITPEDVLKFGLVDVPHREEILADREVMKAQQAQGGAMPPGMPQLGGMPQMGGQMPPMQLPQMQPDQMQLDPTDMAPDPDAFGAIIQQFAADNGLEPEEVAALLQSIGG